MGTDKLNKGTHFTYLYDNPNDQLESVTMIILLGLSQNRKIIGCFNSFHLELLRNKFLGEEDYDKVIFLDKEVYVSWYGEDCVNEMREKMRQMEQTAYDEGYSGVMIVGDGEWISQEISLEKLLQVEQYINIYIRDFDIIIGCFYKKTESKELETRIINLHDYIMKKEGRIEKSKHN
ncbi:MAG: MEDS domain-containing protein [Bacillota bacterium]|nr:MEDS domain-containing protein [Bacillota bacterium]